MGKERKKKKKKKGGRRNRSKKASVSPSQGKTSENRHGCSSGDTSADTSASDMNSDGGSGVSTSTQCDCGSAHEFVKETETEKETFVSATSNDSRPKKKKKKKKAKQPQNGSVSDLSAKQATEKPQGETHTQEIQTKANSKSAVKAEMKKAADAQGSNGPSSHQCLATNEHTEETLQGALIKSEECHSKKAELQEEAKTTSQPQKKRKKKKKKKKKGGIQDQNDTEADHGQVVVLPTSQSGQSEEVDPALQGETAFCEDDKKYRASNCASRNRVAESKKAEDERGKEYSHPQEASTLQPIMKKKKKKKKKKKTGNQVGTDTGTESAPSSQPGIAATEIPEASKTTGNVFDISPDIGRSTPEEGEHSENHKEMLMDAEKKFPLSTQEDVGTPSDNIADTPQVCEGTNLE